MTITNGYSSGSQAFTGSEVLSFTATNIINPRSTTPTSTFTFNIKSSGGTNDIYAVTNPTLTISTASTFTSATITPATGTNGALTSYTWQFTTSSVLVAGDIFKITPPSTITFSSSTSCTGNTGLASSLS